MALTNITMNNSTSGTLDAQFSPIFRIGTSLFSVVLIVGTIFGNSLVIAAFVTFSRLRTATNYFVVSLAVTDLCVAVFSMPVLVAYVLTGPSWVLGDLLNQIWTVMDVLSGTASIANLVAISLDRCLCINKPLMYYQYITTTRVQTAIVVIWVYSVTMAITSYFMRPYRLFNFVASVMYFWVPLLIIITAYSIVFRVAIKHLRQTMSVPTVEPSLQNSFHQRYSFIRELKAAKTLAVVVGAFVICWLPFVVINAIYSICEDDACPYINTIPILVTKWMHYGNSLLNPPIYGFLNKDFRVALKHVICFCKNSQIGEQFNENANGQSRTAPPHVLELHNHHS